MSVSILVVSRDRLLTTVLEHVLPTLPASVASFPSHVAMGKALLNREVGQPQLVVVDCTPPAKATIDGVREALALAGTGSKPRLLCLLGEDQFEQFREEYCGMVDAIVTKPVSGPQVRDAARMLMEEGNCGRSAWDRAPLTPDLSRVKVLLVEDNDVNRAVALGFLRPTGSRVTVAGDGQEAVQMVSSQRFDVVLMDIHMPLMGGVEATARIRALESESMSRQQTGHQRTFGSFPQSARLSIIAMTADTEPESVRRVLQSGMDGYLKKPIEINQLYQVLSKWSMPPTTGGQQSRDGSGSRSVSEADDSPPLPPLPGLDTGTAVARMGGDRLRYLRVLRRLASSLGPLVDSLRDAILLGDAITAHRHAHTLKGLAGTVGASEVESTARQLETSLEHGVGDRAAAVFRALDQPLGALRNTLASIPPEGRRVQYAPQALNADEVAPMIRRLLELLRDNDSSATDALTAIEEAGVPRDMLPALEMARSALEAYDFEQAITALTGLGYSRM